MNSARYLRGRPEIRRLAPAADGHGGQFAGLDQFGDAQLRVGDAEPEVVAQVGLGGHAHGPGADADQLALGVVFARGGGVDDSPRQDPFSEVVDALEAAPGLRGDLAGPEQPFQGPLAFRPGPPARGAARAGGEVAAGDRPAAFDLPQDAVDVVAALAGEAGDALPDAVAGFRPCHAPAEQGLVGDRHQRGLMAPVFEQAGLLAPGFGLQGIAGVVAKAGELGQVVGAGDDVDAVDLDDAEAVYGVAKVAGRRGGRARLGEALGGQGDAPGLGGREGDAGVHGMFRYMILWNGIDAGAFSILLP